MSMSVSSSLCLHSNGTERRVHRCNASHEKHTPSSRMECQGVEREFFEEGKRKTAVLTVALGSGATSRPGLSSSQGESGVSRDASGDQTQHAAALVGYRCEALSNSWAAWWWSSTSVCCSMLGPM